MKSELDVWQRRFVYYAMYYLSATIMLRDSQLATLPYDALTTEDVARPAEPTRTFRRHRLDVFRTKNRFAPMPTQITVNARVAGIIHLLQRLSRALGYQPRRHPATGLPVLFDQRLATPYGKTPRESARDGLYLDLQFLSNMQHGARELRARGLLARDLDDAQLSMRQVRITCAQAFAVREHGHALAAAFGQWDTAAVARGYIGDVYRLITPAEPEEVVDIAREDIGRRLHRLNAQRPDVTGRGQRRLDTVLDRHRVALSNPLPLTASRLRSLGKANANVEQGPLTVCIYQSEGALCGGKGRPDFRLCLPGQCRNSVMTKQDRLRYELMRRQHLALKSPVLRRAADKMHDANPDITAEFAEFSDSHLEAMLAEQMADYVRQALETRP